MGVGDGDRDMVAIKLPNQHALETKTRAEEQSCKDDKFFIIIDRVVGGVEISSCRCCGGGAGGWKTMQFCASKHATREGLKTARSGAHRKADVGNITKTWGKRERCSRVKEGGDNGTRRGEQIEREKTGVYDVSLKSRLGCVMLMVDGGGGVVGWLVVRGA